MKVSRRTFSSLLLGSAATATLARDACADVVSYQYDALGRVVSVTYEDGSVILYSYDAAGNRLQVLQALPGPFVRTIAIVGSAPVNLRTLANTEGYSGQANATITYTLASNVSIFGSNTTLNGGVGIDTGQWPLGFIIDLDLQISGKVYGGGGAGAHGAEGASNASNAGLGGDAVYCRYPIDIAIMSGGQVRGGGGGGGGGGGWSDGSVELYGGGGGGGFPNGLAGPAGGGGGATSGQPGTTSAGGAGGAGSTQLSGHTGGAGGGGGGFASDGSSGVNGLGSPTGWFRGQRSIGGTAGYAIRKNGNTVNVSNNGTISGVVG